QVVAAVGAHHIAGVADVADHLPLGHGLPLAYGKGGHVGVQRGVVAPVVGGAVADLHAVAVAGHAAGRAHHAVRHRIDRRAARGGEVGPVVVGPVDAVRVAVVAADAGAGGQGRAEIQAAGQVRGGVSVVLLPGVGIQLGGGLLVGAAGLL